MSDPERHVFDFTIELDDEAARQTVDAALKRVFDASPEVAGHEVSGASRFGGEVVEAMGVTVLVLASAKQAVDGLRKLIASLKKLRAEVRGIKGAKVVIGGRRVSLEEVTEAELEASVADAG